MTWPVLHRETKGFEGGWGGTHRVSFIHLHACSSSHRMDVRHRGHGSEKDSHPRNGRHASAQNASPHVIRSIKSLAGQAHHFQEIDAGCPSWLHAGCGS